MDNNTLSAKHAKKCRTILARLEPLYLQAQDVLSRKDITEIEARLLAERIVRLRHLLSQWADAEDPLRQNSQLIESIGNFKKKYLELEGLVKERRNTLITKSELPV